MQAEKKRKTWLWIIGWILCFPIPLTILMLRNRKLSPTVRYVIICVAWVAFLAFAAAGSCSKKSDDAVVEEPATQTQQVDDAEDAEESPNNSENESASETQAATGKVYELDGSELGEYGRSVILNADTDMPVEKRLYKLPAGRYTATTTNQKLTSFWVVKDEVTTEEGNTEYPEILQYMGEELDLTAGSNDFNGRAKKEVSFELASDESILLPTETDAITVVEVLE